MLLLAAPAQQPKKQQQQHLLLQRQQLVAALPLAVAGAMPAALQDYWLLQMALSRAAAAVA
jgi:hypothetical protein